MSAFGYGSSYRPSPVQPMSAPFERATQQSRSMPAFDATVEATNPWKDPNIFFTGKDGRRFTREYQADSPLYTTGDPFSDARWNPKPVLNSSMSFISNDGRTLNSLGQQGNYAPYLAYEFNWQDPVKKVFGSSPFGFFGNPDPTKQVDSRTLFSRVNALGTTPQLEAADKTNWQRQFNQAAQEYANAYANQDFAKNASMSYGQATDFLQQAYQKLYKKLNDNYLL